jgi:hypothetical protein
LFLLLSCNLTDLRNAFSPTKRRAFAIGAAIVKEQISELGSMHRATAPTAGVVAKALGPHRHATAISAVTSK